MRRLRGGLPIEKTKTKTGTNPVGLLLDSSDQKKKKVNGGDETDLFIHFLKFDSTG